MQDVVGNVDVIRIGFSRMKCHFVLIKTKNRLSGGSYDRSVHTTAFQ